MLLLLEFPAHELFLLIAGNPTLQLDRTRMVQEYQFGLHSIQKIIT